MITGLDDPAALDPGRVGAKAAALAAARHSGLPVLPGFVVETSSSRRHMEIGSTALAGRGSGGARLVVTAEPVSAADRLVAAGEELGPSLVVRSSTPLDDHGTWAGAFTSYLGVAPEQLPRAVAGCWASAFSVDALERQAHAGVEPGAVPMAVLVQPGIEPVVGGVAEIAPEGTVRVMAVPGSPATLLQGWERGVGATHRSDQEWDGSEAIDLVGLAILDEIEAVLVAADRLGFDRCEWGVAGSLCVFQLGKAAQPIVRKRSTPLSTPAGLVPLVQAVMTFPGVLGSQLVHPWALAGLPPWQQVSRSGGGDAVAEALELSGALISQVWGQPSAEALGNARSLLDRLRGPRPDEELETILRMQAPDPELVSRLLSIVATLGESLVARGILSTEGAVWHLSTDEVRSALNGEPVNVSGRLGVGAWEPLAAAVILDHGSRAQGIPAAAGVGAGLSHHHAGEDPGRPPPRAVVTAATAVPGLSQLIWDAAGLVTDAGSPAAHVFESARSLGVPAVCGVDLIEETDRLIAVDGHSGVVATLPVAGQSIP